MVAGAEAIRGAASEQELRRTYAAALAEAAKDDPYEVAPLRRAFLERQEQLGLAPGPETPPEAARHVSAARDATESPYKRRSFWQKPAFWIASFVMMLLWQLFKRLVLKGGL